MGLKPSNSALCACLAMIGAFYAGCRADSGEYRTRKGAINVATKPEQASDDSHASLQNNETFRFLINLVNVRVRIPAEFLLLSKPQLVRIAANDMQKATNYDFKKGVPISLKFMKPKDESAELTLLFFDTVKNKVSYRKSGEQVQFSTQDGSLIANFTSYESIFIVALASVKAKPLAENAWVEPAENDRASTFDEFMLNQQKLYEQIIAVDRAITQSFGQPAQPNDQGTGTTSATGTGTTSATGTGTTTATATGTKTATGTGTTTATATGTKTATGTGTTTATGTGTTTVTSTKTTTATTTDTMTATAPKTDVVTATDTMTAAAPVPTDVVTATDTMTAAAPVPTDVVTATDTMTAAAPVPTDVVTATDTMTAAAPTKTDVVASPNTATIAN